MTKRELSNNAAYIKRSFKRIGKKHPALLKMLNSFQELALKRAEIRITLEGMKTVPEFSMDTSAFIQGKPVFHNFEINRIDKELSLVMASIGPALSKAFPPLAAPVKKIAHQMETREMDIQKCVDSIMDDNLEILESCAHEINVAPEILDFVLSETIKIIFESMSAELEESLTTAQWTKGYCPMCGAFPDISFLRADTAKNGASEFLKAHGGQFWLHCSQCSHEWRIKRGLCAYCDNENKNDLGYLSVKKDRGDRVYTCSRCQKYIACFDEREKIEPDHPEALAAGAVPLNIIAQDKGFFPMVDTPLTQISD